MAALNRSLRKCAIAVAGVIGVVALPVFANGADGSRLYAQQCIACHGPNGEGIGSLGVPLVNSALIRSASVREIVAFLKVGRMPDDAATLTGGVMPGFAWLADEDLASIAVHLRNIGR